MSKATKTATYRLTPQQWGAVGTAGAAGMTVAGPIGAAGAVVGLAVGCAASNYLGWDGNGDAPQED